MKRILKTYKLLSFTVLTLLMGACEKDFLERPAEDSITLDNYYSTNDQVESATNAMYNKTWFNFHNKAFFAITEVGSGNMHSYSSDVTSMRNFSLSSTDGELENAWKSLWATVAQSNALINFLAERVGSKVDQNVLENTLGEAYFLRATAYFYLVRLWGPVPIIENNLDHVDTPLINTNRIEDIYELIKMDYQTAIEKLKSKVRGSNYANNGHVSKGSAKAMLSKVYLYQEDYTNARALAEEVINSGEFKLLGGSELPEKSFGDLFLTNNNNNEESIFALQWKTNGAYGVASNCNTQFGYSSFITNTTYGGVFGPSQDILTAFGPGDLRRKETIMLPGDEYPNITTADGAGLIVPDDIDAQVSGAGIKKYVVGKAGTDSAGPTDAYGMMENNTYIMRYAELLLIHAEAILAGGSSTTDPAALQSFNAVRNRAGLPSVSSITFDDIFKERRLELAFEGDYWFDLGRIPRADAIAIMSEQNRGDKNGAVYFTPTESDFHLPYPDTDVARNPFLLEDPVPYTFN
ncbi:MAG: RagB/SusD family nutrient uptake outer membrane protein [Bacteroidota bacterium]|uniref:RagB/SusD family nutrient uptake outer membrane protein n=1 Tax=Flagellimonas profundi TaxID=2915620 RepID=A0ABS3FJW4_9FLAO|nr:RagB/SusD family nutrient uptake outer membrane protein [Allomuricauda profundi]MBO0343449.1 RagB/SusD family nutrient uptake outer membrane protein [Allomuricauda profundi]MEC7772317.1 RagB/SusD family nutrient uptake outer membrane protein [Bacteroidota bacterium]